MCSCMGCLRTNGKPCLFLVLEPWQCRIYPLRKLHTFPPAYLMCPCMGCLRTNGKPCLFLVLEPRQCRIYPLSEDISFETDLTGQCLCRVEEFNHRSGVVLRIKVVKDIGRLLEAEPLVERKGRYCERKDIRTSVHVISFLGYSSHGVCEAMDRYSNCVCF